MLPSVVSTFLALNYFIFSFFALRVLSLLCIVFLLRRAAHLLLLVYTCSCVSVSLLCFMCGGYFPFSSIVLSPCQLPLDASWLLLMGEQSLSLLAMWKSSRESFLFLHIMQTFRSMPDLKIIAKEPFR